MKNQQTTNKLIKNHKRQLFNRFIFNRYKTGIINNYDINFIAPNRQNKGYNFCGLVVYYQTPNKLPALIFDLININAKRLYQAEQMFYNSGVDLSGNIETSKPPGIFIINPPEFLDRCTIAQGEIFQIGGTAYE